MYPLVFLAKQPLSVAEKFFFYVSGSVWVNRKDAEDRRRVKEELVRLISNGNSVLWFPEGTWNMTEELLMLPMKWGIVEVAKRSGALIIPMALDYDRMAMVCTVRFGSPIDATGVKKSEAIQVIRDSIATLRWDLMSHRPIQSRALMDISAERDVLWQAVAEYQPSEWENEQSLIFRPYEKVEMLPVSLIPCKNNAFLWNKRNHYI